MGAWNGWIGREERRSDTVNSALAQRWLATFNLADPNAPALPQGFHWCLCTPDAPSADLGDDGHPRRDETPHSFFPPVPLPRRMWAASEVEFLSPLTQGMEIERVSRIGTIAEKSGASGDLVFVTVEHQTVSGSEALIRERQTLVYRGALAADTPLTPPKSAGPVFDPAGWDIHTALSPDPRLLFRYSALTFNTHRIHYDLPYARDVERYRGLVVHGPLTASLLLQMAERKFGSNALRSFAFRAVSPAIADEPLNLVLRATGKTIDMAAFAEDGRQTLTASAQLA